MSSVSSATGISNLMQVLSANAPPAVSALVSSSKVQTALAKAPPADIVQLSDQAMQLQMVGSLFGSSSTFDSTSSISDLFGNTPSDSVSQQETANLAQANVLAAAYSSPSYSATGASSSSTDTGSLINLLA